MKNNKNFWLVISALVYSSIYPIFKAISLDVQIPFWRSMIETSAYWTWFLGWFPFLGHVSSLLDKDYPDEEGFLDDDDDDEL